MKMVCIQSPREREPREELIESPVKKDSIYNEILDELKPFRFDERVAEVFDDMISRSVPGYEPVQGISLKISEFFAQDESSIYDLGCSSGTTLRLLSHSTKIPNSVKIIGVDNSASMIEKARRKLDAQNESKKIELICQDLQSLKFEVSSVILLNYTLQFFPLEKRQLLLNKAFQALKPGGALLLSEKVVCQENSIQQFVTRNHHAFKKNNGYSQLEISQKRQALEDVLVPLSINQNCSLLAKAGFENIEPLLVYLPFATLLAVK